MRVDANHSEVRAFAHTPNTAGRWQPLYEHLENVATLASEYCAAIRAEDVGHWLGLWHDVGKFAAEFQRYLEACAEAPNERRRGPDHKAAGTTLGLKHLGLGALPVQGHHGGLRTPSELKNWLAEFAGRPSTEDALRQARQIVPGLEPAVPVPFPTWIQQNALSAELFVRFLFSALVDADSIDTERHWRPEASAGRGSHVDLGELWSRFAGNQEEFTRSLHASDKSRPVNQIRDAVYRDCLNAASLEPGLFRLNVPTGGGKTRSAMAFALQHALRHDQRRIIVAVPFITITEQTAETYRGMFELPGDSTPVVLEHHSGSMTADTNDDDFHPHAVWNRLAAENWDAPIVITTTVQLFESLFSNMRSRARKVHRLAGSVIILDEAQALPAALLEPILDALRELCEHYGTTVVLSTATQPAFGAISPFAALPARDIVPDAKQHFSRLRRVQYEWRTDEPLDWGEIANILRPNPQGLAVLNTKRDALTLLDALDDPHALHLSTLLCGDHRRQVIATVKERLLSGLPCRLISTQVIEAGVDLDFPLVVRALGPLDAIIQAAGRCNREGRIDHGRVVIVRPSDGALPRGSYTVATGITQALLNAGSLDPDDPAVITDYFGRLFGRVVTDGERIQPLRRELSYPTVAERFRMIEPSESVVVTGHGSDRERAMVRQYLDELIDGAPGSRFLVRALQPYMVSLSSHQAEGYRSKGLITQVMPGIGEWHGRYDPVRGIVAEIGEAFIV